MSKNPKFFRDLWIMMAVFARLLEIDRGWDSWIIPAEGYDKIFT
jgi:hypothetical protein